MKKILLEKLLDNCKEQEYQKQYEYIINLLEKKKIKPVKASRLNGKSPALYREYWLLEETKDYSNFIEELRYQIIPDISVDYYLRHLESYEADREWVLQLNKYLKERKETLQFKVSANERSFEIWGREKFLSKGQGRRILKRCGLEMSFFNIYETTEPLAYYSRTRKEDFEKEFGLEYMEKDEVIKSSDFLSLHTAYVPELHHMISKKELEMMKKSAILINASRGPIVDEDALADALISNVIAGAALDVYEEEPRVNEKLLNLDNVILAPHLGNATFEARLEMGENAKDNLIDFKNGKTPKNKVN